MGYVKYSDLSKQSLINLLTSTVNRKCELEQELHEEKQRSTDEYVSHCSIHAELLNKIIILKHEKEELIEFLKTVERCVNYNDAPTVYIDSRNLLLKHTEAGE